MEKFLALPFKIDEVFEGFAEVDGLININKSSLIMEFQTRDAIFGVIKSNVKKVVLNAEDLIEIKVKKNWFSANMIIVANTFLAGKGLPKATGNELVLEIKKKDLDTAMQIASLMNMKISEIRLNYAENISQQEK